MYDAVCNRGLRKLREYVVQCLIYSAVVLVSAVFIWLLIDLLRGGLSHLSWEFVTELPRDAGRAGESHLS